MMFLSCVIDLITLSKASKSLFSIDWSSFFYKNINDLLAILYIYDEKTI